MKTKQIAAACALIAGFGLAGSVSAQCVLDGTVGPGSSFPATFTGNTCNKNNGNGGTFNLSSFCSTGNVPNGLGTSIIQVNTGASPQLHVSVISSTAGFNPELAVMNGACLSTTGCSVDDTNNTQIVPTGAHATQDTASPAPAANTTGAAFIVISDLNSESPGCGAYELQVNGPLPVKLQNFSVN